MSRFPLRAGVLPRATVRALAAILLPLVSCGPAAPAAFAAPGAPTPFYRELGDLILEGIPRFDERLGTRLERYANAREATFLDWLPDGSMLIATGFGNTTEVHRVETPLGTREQLTYDREPLSIAAARPSTAEGGFAFLEDEGGDENAKVYYYPFASRGAAGDVRLLADGKFHHGGLVWSRDGKQLAFFGNERSEADEDISIADLSGGTKPRLLVAGHAGSWRALDWSPDGRQLLIEQTVSSAEGHLYLADATTGALTPVDPAGRKAAVNAARFAADGRGIYELSDAGGEVQVLRRIDLATHASQDIATAAPWSIEDFDVSADGRYLAYVANQDGRSVLTVLDTLFKLHQNPVGLPDGVIRTLRFDRSGRRLAMTAESAVSPRDVYVDEVERNTVVRWTRSEPGPVCAVELSGSAATGSLNPPLQAAPAPNHCAAFVPAELIHFPTWDRANGGRRMLSAYVYRPRTPGPHPVLIDIHDGPESEARPTFDPFVQFLVNELGYAVVAPNVRGSAGYGRTFLGLDDGALREDALRDIGSLLVWIDLQPTLDRERVAVLGSGYGGYLALASLADYNDRLRGAIDVCGITDFVRFLEHTAAWRQDRERAEYGDEREPEMRDVLGRISPMAKAKWLRRPLLVVQGLDDPRVPATQSTNLIAGLRARGDDVWYLAARDEGHGFRKKSNRDTYYEVAAMFLQRLATSE